MKLLSGNLTQICFLHCDRRFPTPILSREAQHAENISRGTNIEQALLAFGCRQQQFDLSTINKMDRCIPLAD